MAPWLRPTSNLLEAGRHAINGGRQWHEPVRLGRRRRREQLPAQQQSGRLCAREWSGAPVGLVARGFGLVLLSFMFDGDAETELLPNISALEASQIG